MAAVQIFQLTIFSMCAAQRIRYANRLGAAIYACTLPAQFWTVRSAVSKHRNTVNCAIISNRKVFVLRATRVHYFARKKCVMATTGGGKIGGINGDPFHTHTHFKQSTLIRNTHCRLSLRYNFSSDEFNTILESVPVYCSLYLSTH